MQKFWYWYPDNSMFINVLGQLRSAERSKYGNDEDEMVDMERENSTNVRRLCHKNHFTVDNNLI